MKLRVTRCNGESSEVFNTLRPGARFRVLIGLAGELRLEECIGDEVGALVVIFAPRSWERVDAEA